MSPATTINCALVAAGQSHFGPDARPLGSVEDRPSKEKPTQLLDEPEVMRRAMRRSVRAR
jgi:hypothetical protein